MSPRNQIALEQLVEQLHEGTVEQLWNVLTAAFYAAESIPGSRWVSWDRIEREAEEFCPASDVRIVVYGGGPACCQGPAAAGKLATLGYTNVRTLEGGLQAWKAAGLPTTSDAQPEDEG